METTAVISIIVNVVLVTVAYILWTCLTNLARENQKQEEKLRQKDITIANERRYYQIVRAETIAKAKAMIPAPLKFDDKTMKLLNLAVKNSNDNEARNAAKEACKLIYKKLNK